MLNQEGGCLFMLISETNCCSLRHVSVTHGGNFRCYALMKTVRTFNPLWTDF